MITYSKDYINLDDLTDERKVDILVDVAGIPREYLDGKHHPCSHCPDGGKDRFRLIDKAKGTVLCNQCFNENNHGLIPAVIHYGHAADKKEAYKMIKDYLLNNSNDNSPSQSPPKDKLPSFPTGWVYLDENGKNVKRVTRWENDEKKSFYPEVFYKERWRTKAQLKDDVLWQTLWDKVSGIPFNLPTINRFKNSAVFIVEGEKCAAKLNDWKCKSIKHDIVATTGSNGVGTTTDWAKYLAGRSVVILPDSDAAGYKYALKTAQSLQGKAENIRIVFLPDLEEKEDIYDWIKKGGEKLELLHIVANTPTWDGKPFAYKNEGNIELEETETETENTLPEEILGAVEKKLSAYKQEQIEWLLSGIFPLKMVSCLVGDPENGKSTIYQWLAAKITSQEPTYFRDEKIPHGSVLFCNAEEVMGITTKPRLIENGADVDKIYQIESVNVKQKVDGEMQIVQIDMTIEKGGLYLRQVLERHPDCKLVVFDPIAAFYGRIDNYRESEIRPAMKSLNKIAEEFGVAIILVMHYSKMNTTKSIDKTGSSKAVINNSRTAWSTTRDHETGIVTLAKVKNNISRDYMGFEFEIVPGFVVGEEAGHVNILEEYSEKLADDFLREQFNSIGRPPEKCEAAQEWLIEFLKDGAKPSGSINPQPGSIRYEAEKAGFSWRTMGRAARGIIKPERKNETKRNESFWRLVTLPEFGDSAKNKSNFGRVINSENTKIYDANLVTLPKFEVGEETSEKSTDSDEIVITTTIEEINQILKTKQSESAKNERLERINRQTEENFKKMQAK